MRASHEDYSFSACLGLGERILILVSTLRFRRRRNARTTSASPIVNGFSSSCLIVGVPGESNILRGLCVIHLQ